MTLHRRLLEPRKGGSIVLRRAFAAHNHVRQGELTLRVARFGGSAIPRQRGGNVLGRAQAVAVEICEIDLRAQVAASRALREIVKRLLIIVANPAALKVKNSEVVI